MNLPSYFDDKTWKERVEAYLSGATSDPFVGANVTAITRSLRDRNNGLRMVVNIPADALLSFLRDGKYRNAYDQPRVGGERRVPSETRLAVDKWLNLGDPRGYYFGAVAIGGTGVRFYGEYCMVLKRDSIQGTTRVFDRNSYDLARPPFDAINEKADLVRTLGGEWDTDLIHIVAMKLLPEIRATQWLVTLGTVSDALLHDEEFIEVHKQGSFGPSDIEEIREAPDDEAIHTHILSRYEDGESPSLEEVLWVSRRNKVRKALTQARIANRVVVSSGRGDRWK